MPNTYIRRPEDRRGKERDSSQRVRVPRWIDPIPWIQGSSIEKMVMAELVRRGIYFEHTPQTNTLGGFVDPSWEPDFLLPQYKIWIEIQGAYFHTLPGAIEADSLRFALIEAAGWRPIFWWEDDIRMRLMDLFNEVPEFRVVVNKQRQPSWPNFATWAKGSWPKTWRVTPGLPFWEGALGYKPVGTAQTVDHLAGLRKALSNRARPPQDMVVRRRKKRKVK